MKKNELYTLGIDIGSTTVKIAVLGADKDVYKRQSIGGAGLPNFSRTAK